MDISLEPGSYVLAVSGGVDSVSLLHLLAQRPQPAYKFTVAHFDHGIRDDSNQDRQLVQAAARHYGLPFIYLDGHLSPITNEAVARKARYDFLHNVRHLTGAQAIITAHHQDDLLETALINIVRGTGRRGLSSLKSTDVVKRPILHVPKAEIYDYARDNQLVWNEDSTNRDQAHLRNYLRHQVIPRLTPEQRHELLDLIQKVHQLNDEIDTHLATHLHVQPALDRLDRHHFVMLPHVVGMELLAAWLRRHDIQDFDRKTLQRLSLAAKTYRPGRLADINAAWQLQVNKTDLALTRRDR